MVVGNSTSRKGEMTNKSGGKCPRQERFSVFSGFRFEPIEAVQDYYSIRIGGQ
jgi:hypothetical protein